MVGQISTYTESQYKSQGHYVQLFDYSKYSDYGLRKQNRAKGEGVNILASSTCKANPMIDG